MTERNHSDHILELLDEIEDLVERWYWRIRRRIAELRELVREEKVTWPAPRERTLRAPESTPIKEITEEETPIRIEKPLEVPTSLSETEVRILRIIRENPEEATAPLIARRIGKSREHTARLMKKLYQKGYLVRDESKWPYVYHLSERAKRELGL